MLKAARSRAHYTDEFKRQVVAEAASEGASVAAVARRHGLNANLVFGWRRDARFRGPEPAALELLPVTIAGAELVAPAVPVTTPEPSRMEIVFGERVRVCCEEEISETALQRLARVFGRGP